MTVDELRNALTSVPGDWVVMIQVEQQGAASLLSAAENVYQDFKGSQPVIVIDLFGMTESSSVYRNKLVGE